ncbi:hypothetical protein FJY94_03530 [Candidatus Kaiserbacteria bacterium]|nr:hypothetical protein [Candidatus Kaiserbacteria bacterium]
MIVTRPWQAMGFGSSHSTSARFEDEPRRLHKRPLHAPHARDRLEHAVAADTEVPDRLTEVGCEIFLSRLAVAYLVALPEAVAVGVQVYCRPKFNA